MKYIYSVLNLNLNSFIFSEGGFFNARMTFPKSYPQMPPKLQFISEIWHPNGKKTRLGINYDSIFFIYVS